MNHTTQNILLNITVVILVDQLGADKASDLILNTLDNKVEMNQAKKVEEQLFEELGITPGQYDEKLLTFSNSAELKEALTNKLSEIHKSNRIA